MLLGDRDLDCGMRTMEVTERLGEAMVDGPCDTDPKPSAEEAAQRRDLIAAAVGGGERCARMRQERLASRREPDRALIAMKQRLAQLRVPGDESAR